MAETCDHHLNHVFEALTDKQKQTIELLAEGWTSKEIATQLGISESAVVQRIENLRAKAGGALRKDLARQYREFASENLQTCNQITGNNFHLPAWDAATDSQSGNNAEFDLVLGDAMPFESTPPWANRFEPPVVPEVLDGENATLFRLLAAVGLAVGMVVLTLVLLAVSEALGKLV